MSQQEDDALYANVESSLFADWKHDCDVLIVIDNTTPKGPIFFFGGGVWIHRADIRSIEQKA